MFHWEVAVGKALIDLGASINKMPLSMCRRLRELEIIPTRMTLQLADRSITIPYGMIEDVLVKVKHLIFTSDFVVIDIEEDVDIPFILGHLFMSITTKSVGNIRCFTFTKTSSITPYGLVMERSSN